MSLLDKDIPNINTPTIRPTKYVRIPTQATAAETGSEITSWYDWLVNRVPKSIRDNVSSAFGTVKEKITALYRSPATKPTQYVREPVHENAVRVSSKMREWQDWLVDHIPKPITRNVSSAFKTMKDKIMGMYISKPVLVKTSMRTNTQLWYVDGGGYKDPKVFLDNTTAHVEELINGIDSIGKKVYTNLICEMIRSDPKTGEDTITIAHFRSKTHSIISEEDTSAEYETMKRKMSESLAEFQKQGSGWRLYSVDSLEISITKYKPLNGKSYSPLPKVVKSKRAIINMENDDDKCFMWSILRYLNPTSRDNKNPGRISKTLAEQAETSKLDWTCIEYPVKVKDIGKFEKINDININVFSYDDESKNIYTLRLSKGYSEECINLFLYDEHYSLITDIGRLASSQLSNGKNKKHICIRCMFFFGSPELLIEHLKLCKNHEHQKHVYPKISKLGDIPTTEFKHYHRLHKIPFTVYADFESFIVPIHTVENELCKSHTTKYQKHIPSGFCYSIKCVDKNVYRDKTVIYTMTEEGEDIGKKFVESLEEDIREVYDTLKTNTPIQMTRDDVKNYVRAVNCYACGAKLGLGGNKVRDHDHLTGKYRGAAHRDCNLKMRVPKFIPVLFHNLEGYDSHLFVKSLGLSEGDIKCIPKTDEKYISFSKNIVTDTYTDKKGNEKNISLEIRFLDSLKFTLSSLDSLVKNLDKDQFKTLEKEMGMNSLLKKKGVYPYEYMTGFSKLQEDRLPPKGEFYSKLNNTDISDEDYVHAQKVWETFGCKTMRDYHNLYLKTDTLLLADVMENHKDLCMASYGLDPLWYYTAPGLALDASLKVTGAKLELLTDPDMYLMIEQGIRGGVSTITKRYAKADNKYIGINRIPSEVLERLGKLDEELNTDPTDMDGKLDKFEGDTDELLRDYDDSDVLHINTYLNNNIARWVKNLSHHRDESTYIPYLDANNLYGWAMSEPLPVGGFTWMTDEELNNWIVISDTSGTGCILEVDLKYPEVLHDLHNEYPLAPEKVKVGDTEKLIPNLNNKERYVLHHKNLKQYISMGLVLTKIHRGIKFIEEAWLAKYIQLNTDLRTKGTTDFEKNFFKLMNNSVFGKTMENVRNRVDVRLVTREDKLLKLSKKPNFEGVNTFAENLVAVHMNRTTIYLNKPVYLGMSILDISKTLMYDFHYNYIKKKYGDNAELLFTDTDSLCYEIHTDDFYKDISPDIHTHFDTSNFDKDHPSGIPTGINKKVIGMMKDEAGGKQIAEFVGLRSKLYSYRMDDSKQEEKKCKGVRKGVIRNEITFNDYKDCLLTGNKQHRSMNTFRSRKHEIYTERINKIALSANDDKRIVLEDGIHTTAYGHRSTEAGYTTVSEETTDITT